MQEKSFQLQNKMIGSIPIIQKFLTDLGLKDLLLEALQNDSAAAAIETLLISILIKPNALYRVGHWAKEFR